MVDVDSLGLVKLLPTNANSVDFSVSVTDKKNNNFEIII